MIHDAAEYIDYISPHYYQTLDKYGTDGVEEYGRYLDKLSRWIGQSKNPDMRIFLSEWNLDGIDMRTGLFAGGFLNRLESTSRLEMASPALLLRHTSAKGWNNAFINFNQTSWFPAPNYVVFKLWREHFLPNRVILKGDTKGINAIATVSDDKKRICLKMVNPINKFISVTLVDGKDWGISNWEVISSGKLQDSNSMKTPDKIKVEKKPVKIKGKDVQIVLPPYSASVLSFN